MPLCRLLLLYTLGLLLLGCSSRYAPAPVTTLELRENYYQQRNRGSLDSSSYKVQRGDTLYAIAFRAGKDVRELAALNNIVSPYTIYPGQTLRLTGKAKPKPTTKPKAADSKKAARWSGGFCVCLSLGDWALAANHFNIGAAQADIVQLAVAELGQGLAGCAARVPGLE